MIETLLAIMWATLINVKCDANLLGYYYPNTKDIYICGDNYIWTDYTRDDVIIHELWHMFQVKYVKKWIDTYESRERFAHNFAGLYNKDRNVFVGFILWYIKK